jgi:glycosyltransferase involved in cell wall biosynthesis
MVFIFWQNIISIHQQAFLEALAKQPGVQKVVLAVEQDISQVRKNMGWEAPRMQGVEIKFPAGGEVAQIVIAHKDAIHVMSGIRAGRMITAAFDACIVHKCRMGIMAEPYDNAGIKGIFRRFKYQYFNAKYAKYIQFVLAIGKQGVAQFMNQGYDAHLVFPWAYFITIGEAATDSVPHNDVRIIYAGRLTEAKGIYRFAQELTAATTSGFKLDIYGEGPDEQKIKNLATAKGLSDKISITPFLKYSELLAKYKQYDWVVLPSTQKDGWGAIVSEGLLSGLKAICSRKCGASWAVKEGINGVTFDWSEAGSCRRAVGKMLAGNGFAASADISVWARKSLSGEAGAQYFIRIINCVYEHADRPVIPWEGRLNA